MESVSCWGTDPKLLPCTVLLSSALYFRSVKSSLANKKSCVGLCLIWSANLSLKLGF